MGFVYTDIAVPADGFAAGPRQSEASPLGEIDEGALEQVSHPDVEPRPQCPLGCHRQRVRYADHQYY